MPKRAAPLGNDAAGATEHIARYPLLDKIGEGGTGTVYKVYDPQLQRAVALKVIHPHRVVSASALRRFTDEARTTARLQHPSVVPVHEIGRLEDGRVYFTMQQVEGQTLAEALRAMHRGAPGAPTQRDLIAVLQRVAEAVSYAHAQDIVHRDLKPDNVMLGEYGEVYVLDWGIARLLGSPEHGPEAPELAPRSPRLTGFGQAMGSPDYMAPEQAAGAAVPIDHTADIYALGGMLFEILVGRPPILGLADIEQNLASSTEDGAIPHGLEDLLRRTLTPDPKVRYTDTRGVLKGLRSWLEVQTQWARSRALLGEARELLDDARALEAAAADRQARAKVAMQALPDGADDDACRGAWDLEDEAAALHKRSASLREERVHLLRLALAAAPEHIPAQDALAEHYLEQHKAAEAAGDETASARAEVMLRRFDRGRFRGYLAGDGSIRLRVDAPGAAAALRRWTTQHRRHILAPDAVPLPLPAQDHPIPRGSYVVDLSAPGRVSAPYPIVVTREARWDCGEPVRLPPEGAVRPGERVVLGGWTLAGGDAEAAGSSRRQRRYWIPGFTIAQHPVTNGAYLRYLSALWAKDPDAAQQALPQPLRGGQLRLGAGGPDLRPGSAALPVVGVTFGQAQGYARWRAQVDGLPWRLPGEWEWEKAARGVDGRRFPWGDHFTASRCSMRLSRTGGPAIDAVGAFPVDCSPYGVADTAGGVTEWCSTTYDEPPPNGSTIAPPDLDGDDPELTLRGGSWRSTRQGCLLARRSPALPDWAAAHLGFRLARTLP